MSVWFTSDTHFGHAAIIQHCDRPFASVAEMNEALIARWNESVAPGDTVYHLGDFCFCGDEPVSNYRRALNGDIHLILGNHDDALTEDDETLFASVSSILEIKLKKKHIVLCHYPMREWHGSWRGAWHLYGHVHGRLNHEPLGYSLDVGVDSNHFQPWHFEEIGELFADFDNPFDEGRRPKPVRKTIREPWRP